MQNRPALLAITGFLAFGSLGYFLFLYDDGSQPKWTSPNGASTTPQMRTHRQAGPLGSAHPGADSTAAPVIATTPAPESTAPPE